MLGLILTSVVPTAGFHAPLLGDASTYIAAAALPQVHGNPLFGGVFGGGAVGAAMLVKYAPVQTLKVSLTALTPMATHLERWRARDESEGRLSKRQRYKGLTLPSLAMLHESCCLLDSTEREDVYLCQKAMKSPQDHGWCTFDLDLSEYYGEPVYLCRCAIA